MILEISLCVSLVLLAVVSYFCIRFALVILKVQEAVESSLDILDERYGTMSEILARPLFYDSPEVRGVLRDIDASRDAIHNIAISLTKNFDEEREDER